MIKILVLEFAFGAKGLQKEKKIFLLSVSGEYCTIS
jgi:hypothetical protein